VQSKILKHLEKAKYGYLQISTPSENNIEIGDKNSDLKADLQILNWEMIDLVLLKGDIGFGESYIKQFFTTSNIADLLLFISLNQHELQPLFHSNFLYSTIFKIKNLLKKNSLKGSKKNIEYHYDLGNDFYKLWLDKTMSYSSAIFAQEDCLATSQNNKYQRILAELNQQGKDILEIGCGWAGFIKQASKQGFNVKGLTLSSEQKKYSEEIIAKEKLNAQIALQDYRLENGKFDNIVSIEMFEAVGKQYWHEYFAKIKQALKKEGKAVIQTITIADEFYNKYLKTSDYIREYIFPGGFLPSENIFKNLAKKNGLAIINEFKFADSYQKTLLIWLENFNQVSQKIINLGYNQEFIRKWQFYLAYCAAGFASKRTNVIQYSLAHA
jgi:cyclopropane-fatty-acyl-phospholipid synthase